MPDSQRTILENNYPDNDKLLIYFQNNLINIETIWYDYYHEDDVCDHRRMTCDSDEFLKALAKARLNQNYAIKVKDIFQSKRVKDHTYFAEFEGKQIVIKFGSGTLELNLEIDFDSLFLDSFSVIENSEFRKRNDKSVFCSDAENALINIIESNPNLIHQFSPREFEVFVATTLSKLGFYNIKLSRFTKDGGYDIYAITFDGEKENIVLIEVKHYAKKKIGLEILDRLNGVRDREGAHKGILVTSSKFTYPAKTYYSSNKNIALVDFDKIIELLYYDKNWGKTFNGLWTNNITSKSE